MCMQDGFKDFFLKYFIKFISFVVKKNYDYQLNFIQGQVRFISFVIKLEIDIILYSLLGICILNHYQNYFIRQ